MYDKTRFDVTQMLLHDILLELRKHNPIIPEVPTVEDKMCVYCGKVHVNKGQELNCVKKFKKEAKV
jgi:hypothetical protein